MTPPKSTYDHVTEVAERMEIIASRISSECHALYYNSIEPHHNEGDDVDNECGMAELEKIKGDVANLADWLESLIERIDEHKAALTAQAENDYCEER